MNAVVNQAGENVTEFRAAGPGERLRAARLAIGLETPKLAAQLHLSDDMVAALERDEYDALPGRVFVRGYMRNYARLVGLPVESILKQFDERCPDQDAARALGRVGTSVRAEVRSSHGVMRVFTLVIVFGLLGLFVVWWKGYLGWVEQAPQPVELSASQLDAPLQPDELALPAKPDAGLTTAAGTAPADSHAEAAASVAVAPAGATGTVEPPVAAAPVTADLVSTLPAASAGVPASTGIELEFLAPCWVDVRDAKRSFKLFGEMPKGARKTLGGEPPYKVVLGNAAAVRILVNGAPYDISQHARGNVARFTLDPAGSID